ncbi:MAG: helix-turn-helix domain-containing protein [Myxacorys californica WJT36-NPBG1]|jgi:transcriptional regulator with XRE-family HTH domain|nr:helix-turn-helix domain-containing protein [Myxacorys californica WJT36-NPBG1]
MGKIPVSKVAELRRKADLTQLELAQAVGVTESTISNWEKGRNALVWFERVARLCKTLECSPEQLIDYVEAVQETGDDSPD